VPEHWEAAPIKRFGLLKGGAGFPHENQGQEDAELSFHKVNALGKADHRGVLPPSENTITRETAKKLGAFVFPPSAIVFAKVGAALLMGRIRVLKRDACIDNNMMGLVVHSETHDFRFAMYAMQLVHFDLIANPGAVPSLNEGQIGNFKLAVPPVEEQSYIATFLDHETAKIDALIAEQQRLIELLQEKRQAVISHAVTKGLNPDAPMKDSGVEWLGEVPEHWAVCSVGHRYEVRLGKMLDEKRVTGKHLGRYLRNTDVQWETINTEELPEMDFEPSEHERYSLREGDLLVCEGGEVGRSAIWQSQLPVCFYQKALHRLRPLDPSRDNPGYQLCIMRMACAKGVFEASSGKATINHLPGEAFKRYRFAYPPSHEQDAINEHLSRACRDICELQKQARSLVTKLQERRSALISAAVTGQIDVRGLAPEAVAA
jgi:type I restriction enzyme S subunit